MGGSQLKLEPTLCHGLIEAIAVSLRSQADRRGVKLVVARNLEDIVARTDRRVLSTIVIGLINEAIESSSGGVVHVSVLRCTTEGKNAVEISIAGLAADQQGAAARPQERDSFGLSQAQVLAATLGGKISIHCRAGEGNTYVLLFPEF